MMCPLPYSAMDKFRDLDKRGQSGAADTSVLSTHQNAITQIFPMTGPRDSLVAFSTTGIDGKLVIWNCKSIESQIAGIKFWANGWTDETETDSRSIASVDFQLMNFVQTSVGWIDRQWNKL